jgi:hypothetical protein
MLGREPSAIMGAHGLLKEEIKKPVHDSFSHDFKT